MISQMRPNLTPLMCRCLLSAEKRHMGCERPDAEYCTQRSSGIMLLDFGVSRSSGRRWLKCFESVNEKSGTQDGRFGTHVGESSISFL